MDILKGIRPLDYVLAAVMVGLAVLLGLENVLGWEADSAPHPIESDSVLIVPVFALSALPILWRRRNVLAAIAVSTAVLAASLVMFGWITRCGFALPLSFAFAYAVARFVDSKRNQMIGLAGVALLQFVTLVMDSTTDGLSAIVFALPLAMVFYGIGLIVQNRANKDIGSVAPPAERVPA